MEPQAALTAVGILLSQSRYRMDVPGCPHFLDVLSFGAEEALSEAWLYRVVVTCSAPDIDCATLLNQPASFTFQLPVFTGAPAIPVRTVYGVVQSFRRLSTSPDESRYALRLVPRIALLAHTSNSAVYLNQSVSEVVEQLLRQHGLAGPDFEFRLTQDYPARELITQWQETDLAFIRRLLAEVGIFWRFEMDDRLEQDVVIFQDGPQHYHFGVSLPLRDPAGAGMSDGGQESVWDIHAASRVVSAGVATRDYNYREALAPQDSAASVRSAEGITTGEVYHYAEPFLSAGDPDAAESGAFYARLRHERLLNQQHAVSGRSTSPRLTPGQVLETDRPLPALVQEGMVITRVLSSGSRSSSFALRFAGIPYGERICYRPARLPRPRIAGTLPARVESREPGDIYAWLDEHGRYRVRLDFDRSDSEAGFATLWLRLAKPYAGDTYGWHAPLTDGTEVAVAFDGGDPDRPYIAYARHDSAHPDPVTRANHTRNILRTPANNELRMEDLRQQEHVRLSTEFGTSQLGMGHLVDGENARRGSGFELRTDERGAVRAAKGLFLTAETQAKAQGEVLEMAPAVGRIRQANAQMEALNGAAEVAGALTSDITTQTRLVTERLDALHSAVLLGSAPRGVALTSGEHLQLAATGNIMLNAGQHLDVGAMRNLSLAVEQALGLFAHKDGAKLVANQGRVDIEAQHNGMSLFAEQQLTLTSRAGEIIISTPETLTLNGGGSYLQLNANGIEHGSQGAFMIKATDYVVTGKGTSQQPGSGEFSKGDVRVARKKPAKHGSN